MDFVSLPFLILLVLSFILYYLIGFLGQKTKIKIPQWTILLIASLVFYGFTNWIFLIYLGGSFLITYFATLLIQFKVSKNNDKIWIKIIDHKERKAYENVIAIFAILIIAGVLAVLKYYNFFTNIVHKLINLSLPVFNFVIPLGISFYTFSLISYIVDCNLRRTEAEINPLKLLLFISYFPKMLQGPISSYNKMKENGLFANHKFIDAKYLNGFFRISVGLIKKFAIANIVGIYVNGIYSNIGVAGSGMLIFGSLLYTIQIFCDFSGYMDLAIGISSLFGIDLEENFNSPYLAFSIQDFWRRWHITLGIWLRKYVYIPLGGNRVKPWRWIVNTLIVWLISGLWHGANTTFIFWGLFNGVLLVIEGLPKQIKKSKRIEEMKNNENQVLHFFRIIITFLLVNLGWVFFRSANMNQAVEYIKGCTKVWNCGTYNVFKDANIMKANWLFNISLISIILLICLQVYKYYRCKFSNNTRLSTLAENVLKFFLTTVFTAFGIFVCIYANSIGTDGSAFIYFNF